MKYLLYYKLFENFQNLPTVEEINKILQNPTLLGSGGNANVYNINNNYVLRVIKGNSVSINKVIPIENKKLNFDYGQIVAKTDNNSITILKKMLGIPIAEWSKRKRTIVDTYYKNIKTLSEFPQESFDDFANKVLMLKNQGIAIDPSKSNNFLIDSEKKKINIVDVNDNKEITLDVAMLFVPLVSTIFINTNKLRGNSKFTPLWREIKTKIENAAKKVGISGDLERYDFIFKSEEQTPVQTSPVKTVDNDDTEGW
jgi:hypothetical protein